MKKLEVLGGVVGFFLAWRISAAFGHSLKDDVGGPLMVALTMTGVVMPAVLKRALLGASSGFWHSVPGRWIIGRLAGAVVYTALVALLWKPAFYFAYHNALTIAHFWGLEAAVRAAPIIVLLTYAAI